MAQQASELVGRLPAGVKRLPKTAERLVKLYHPRTLRERGLWWSVGLMLITLLVINLVLTIYWDQEPDLFDVRAAAAEELDRQGLKPATGAITTATLIKVAETLLDRPGGYMSNDIMPPTVWMDNVPNWEFGVLLQVRDLARALRNDMSRSQSQSTEDLDLAEAEPKFNFSNNSWLLPASETQYREGITRLRHYLRRLANPDAPSNQFYARADNLRDWLATVEKRLGSISQRLSASVGRRIISTALAEDTGAQSSTERPELILDKTLWAEIDDVFYEARGTTWALIEFLHAAEMDFAETLDKRNALVSLRQIIRELESTQGTVWSPMVLNGSGFGFVTNYSLIMASYISRAHAAVIDLRNLLPSG
jgi:Uncharacterized protein conserved in bacteria